MSSGRIAFAGRSAFQCSAQFGAQQRKIALDPAFAPDQHMIGCGEAVLGEEIAQQLAEAPLHPVADNRVADSFGNSYAKPDLLRLVGA